MGRRAVASTSSLEGALSSAGPEPPIHGKTPRRDIPPGGRKIVPLTNGTALKEANLEQRQ